MDKQTEQAMIETDMGDTADLNVIAQFLVDFFEDVEKHQGRMLKRDRCKVAKKACWKILKSYNDMALKYNNLVLDYRQLIRSNRRLREENMALDFRPIGSVEAYEW